MGETAITKMNREGHRFLSMYLIILISKLYFSSFGGFRKGKYLSSFSSAMLCFFQFYPPTKKFYYYVDDYHLNIRFHFGNLYFH